MQLLTVCIELIEQWNRRLKLNHYKTHIIWIRTHQQLTKVSAAELTQLLGVVCISTTVFDLSFIGDSELNISDSVHQIHS